jgi:hypothetical protein
MFQSGQLVTVDGYDGVAWRIYGREKIWEPSEFIFYNEDGEEYVDYDYDSGEWVESNDGPFECIMVGDDRSFYFDESAIHFLDGDVCSCGQTSCGWGA